MQLSINGLRKLIGALAVLFPIMLILGGLMSGTPVQESLSAYHWTTVREIFTGFIVTFAIILAIYNGYDKWDRLITALASVMMFLVAFFPMQGPTYYLFQFIPRNIVSVIHYVSAGGAFTLMAVMSLYQFTKTGNIMPPTFLKLRRNLVYRICGYAIIVSIAGMLLVELVPGLKTATYSFRLWYIIESICPIAFGFSWFVKGGGIWRD